LKKKNLGFYLQSQKQYFKKDLHNFKLKEYEKEISKLKYKNLPEVGDEIFIGIFQKIQSDSFNVDAINDANDPANGFNELKDPERFYAEMWFIAFLEEKPVGIVLAGIDKNLNPVTGFIQFVGVLPEYRNRGLGTILLKKGINEMTRSGAKAYIGSTDKKNIPMSKVFASLECRKGKLYNIWVIEKY